MKTFKFKTKNKYVLNHPYITDVLIYDIETDSLDVNIAKCKFFGAYSYKYEKYFMFTENEKESIQRLLDEHRVLVGYNNKFFDGPILENSLNRFNLDYKIVFDCLAVLYDYKRRKINREWDIRLPDGMNLLTVLPNRQLKTVGRVLGLSTPKGDIDYKLFQQKEWTDTELKSIYQYLFQDVQLTRELFEFYVEHFEPFKEYVNDENIRRFDYIRSSLGSYSYSAICHLTGMDAEFEDDFEKLQQRPLNEGGFVLDPQVPYAEGTIIYADFASLYPHILFMNNLYSPVPDDTPNAWKGGTLFTGLQSAYKGDEPGKIETVLKDIYNKRNQYKKDGNLKQYALKIMINTLYGITGSPIFKNVFTMTTSGDCTYIARTCLHYMIKRFTDYGYQIIYGDTDSCFIHLPVGKTVDDYTVLADKFSKELLDSMLFPVDTFKLDIDDIFKKIWLFKKKNYIGININDKIIIKGLPIKKHNASHLGMKIFEKIKPEIIKRQTIKFPKEYFEKLINEEIEKDITIIGQVYNVRNPEDYKSTTSLQCQIAKHLGEGSHILIPNKSLGEIGKTKKYCSPEQAKILTFSDLFLDKVWTELSPFIDGESFEDE
jgi:DNA polymerase elongation subunit (family B)